jgi:hypothetical protein
MTRTFGDFQQWLDAKQTVSRMTPIIAGQTCIGFLLTRGREGIEAFDRNERSLGLFPGPIEAAAAVEQSVAPACSECVGGGAP